MAEQAVTVDFSHIFDANAIEALATPIRQAFLQRIIELARAEWVRLAIEGLRTTRRSYLAGLSASEVRDGIAYITLAGALPNRIENGYGAYDLHDVLLGNDVPVVPRNSGLKGKHVKKGGGFYRAIPFRHATPGTEGAVGQAMGEAYKHALGETEAKALGDRIYALAKKLRVSKEIAGTRRAMHRGKVAWGGRIRAKNAGPKLRPHHHSPIMAGMVKVEKTYDKTDQSQYMTFRQISTGSPGWRVAAKPGIHLVRMVEQHVNSQAEATLRRVMQPLFSL